MKLLLGTCFLFLAASIQAQELEDFLACARYSERVERVLCLETTLDEAVAQDEAADLPQQPGATAVEEPPVVELADEPAGNRLEEFGRDSTRVVVNANGEDELLDVVAALDMIRPNILQITLASGQVWRQAHVRRFNLRAGDEVRIYPSGWGDNYRLETPKLSGFIQVIRVE